MSHFTIVVVGDDVEGQLAAYDENLQVEPYKERLDADSYELDAASHREHTKQRKADYEAWVADGKPDLNVLQKAFVHDNTKYWMYRVIADIESGSYVLPDDIDAMTDDEVILWYNNADGEDSVARDAEGWFRWSTYSHNSKWDWWTIGGRWAGFFKVKSGVSSHEQPKIPVNPFSPELTREDREHFEKLGVLDGRHTDQARKRDIDFEGMREDARSAAGKDWDDYQRVTAGTPPLRSWQQVCSEMGFDLTLDWTTLSDEERAEQQELIKAARTAYHEQPRMQALNSSEEFKHHFFMGDGPDTFEVPREDFMERAARHVAVPFALVINGEWIGKGDMGWFGMSSGEVDQEVWNARVHDLYDSLDGDTLLTLVDAHI